MWYLSYLLYVHSACSAVLPGTYVAESVCHSRVDLPVLTPCTKRYIDMDANMTTLEAALEAAVNRSVTLPVSERPAFIGRCLIASHHGLEPPHSPERQWRETPEQQHERDNAANAEVGLVASALDVAGRELALREGLQSLWKPVVGAHIFGGATPELEGLQLANCLTG